MADQAINALSTKTAPETSDQLLLVGTGEPQLIDYDKLADAILNKITSKNYALDAGQMTLLAALNKLNSDKISNNKFAVQHIRYEDSEVIELGGLDACMRDALNNTIQKDGAFYGTFTANIQYLMLGYRYANGTYGVVILFGYNNSTERWNINDGKITKV
jgi:hypothetical protein